MRYSIFNTSHPSPSRGFSAIELVIVLGILVFLLISIISPFLNFRRSSILNTETQELITLTNRARLLSVSSKNDQQFGVHFEAGKIVLFQGPTYSAGALTNEIHLFSSAITLSPITINGGGADVLFEKVTGATSQNATTTLLIVGTTSSSTVLIYPTGVATIK